MIKSNIKKVSESLKQVYKTFSVLILSASAIIILLSLLTSIIFYLGYFHFLGIFTSDINFGIFELIDLEIFITSAVVYCLYLLFSVYNFEKENKNRWLGILNENKITLFQKTGFALILFLIFIILLVKFFGVNYDSQIVQKYLQQNIPGFFVIAVILVVSTSFIFQFKKLRSVVGFLILIIPLILSYFIGMYRGQELALGPIKNNYVITISKNEKFDCFLIKRFRSGDLVFYRNEVLFIDSDNRTVRFKNRIDS